MDYAVYGRWRNDGFSGFTSFSQRSLKVNFYFTFFDFTSSQSQYHNADSVAEVQLALIRCIEEILNCEYGLDTLGDTQAEEPVRILGEVAIALDSPSSKLKSKAAKLLAAVCCVDENKHG